MAYIQRNEAGRLVVAYIEGFITPQQEIGEAVEFLGSVGVDVQVINTRAPQSDIVLHFFAQNRNDAIAQRDYLTACAWQFGEIADDAESQFAVLFYGPIAPRILKGNYTWDGNSYDYRIVCPLRVEAQAEA